MITIELTAAIDAVGTLKQFFVSDAQFVTLPTDTPANVAFDAAITDLTVRYNLFREGQSSGNSSESTSELVLSNVNGQYDAWLDYSFDGRDVVIRDADQAGPYPASFTNVFVGTVTSVDVSFKNVVIKMRDKQAIFDKPVLTSLYLGDNVPPNGLEGGAELKGKRKPYLLGSVFNIEPELINSSKLTYQISTGAVTSIVVKDKGVPLAAGANYATAAALQAAVVAGGTYATCLAAGLFRLGSAPAGKVTADAIQGAAASDRTVSALLGALASLAGLAPGDIDAPAFTALGIANPAIVGIYLTGDVTFSTAMDELANSIGAYYGFNPAGKLTTGIFTQPTGFADFMFYDYDIFSDIGRTPERDNNAPSYEVALGYRKNYAPFSGDLAGSVSPDNIAALSKEYITELATDNSIKLKYNSATRTDINTLLTVKADAVAEAARRLALYKIRRDVMRFSVNFASVPPQGLFLSAKVQIVYERLGLDTGKLFRLLGIAYDLRSKKATLIVWG